MAHLTADQLESFRGRLVAERDAVTSLLDRTSGEVRPVDLGLPIGRLSRVDALQMQGVAQLNRGEFEIRRDRVKVALAAIDNGTYGSCRACKGAVDLARLEAQPEVPFCVECQESFEQGE